MDCLNCSARSICKIYDAMQKYQHVANIMITNCTAKLGTNSLAPIVSTPQPAAQQRSPEELINISQRIKELSKTEAKPTDYVLCPDCEEEVESSSMIACTSCGNKICRSCIVTSYNIPICEECYFKARDKMID